MHEIAGAIWGILRYCRSTLDECFGNGHGEGYKQLYNTSLIDYFSKRRSENPNKLFEGVKYEFLTAEYIEVLNDRVLCLFHAIDLQSPISS
jgi:hypothetical protein